MRNERARLWVLAMNSTHARILRGLNPHAATSADELVMQTEARKLRDIMSDKPGREFSSGSLGRRSAVSYASDAIAEDRRAFIRQVLAMLEDHRRAGEFDRLAIFAEHEVLGDLRHLLPSALKAMLVREVPKNLLHLSAEDLATAVFNELDIGQGLS